MIELREELRELLPPVLIEIADVIGLRAALALVEHWGGTRLCVPHQLGPDSELAAALGEMAARKLVEVYRGEIVQVPRAAAAMRRALYLEMAREYDSGKTAAQLARKHGVTERWIFYVLQRMRKTDDPQPDLF